MDRYPHFTIQARDQYGNVAAYARVTVLDGDSGAAITTYYDDGVTVKSSIITDSQGWADFYTAKKKVVSVTVTGTDGTFTIPRIAADTVEDHRQTGDHAAGTITPDQLSFSLPDDPDLALHTVMESNTHGLAANEYFACTKAGSASAATSSPDFADVTVDSLAVTTGGTIHGTIVCDADRASIVAAIAAANDGDTILIKGSGGASSSAIDVSSGTISVDKGLTIAGLGGIKLDFSGANPLFTVDSGSQVTFRDLRLNRTSGASDCFKLVSNETVHFFNVVMSDSGGSGRYGVLIDNGGTTCPVFITNCYILGATTALYLKQSANGVFAVNSFFYNVSITNFCVLMEDALSAVQDGCTFVGCHIEGGKYTVKVDMASARFSGCYILDQSGVGEAVNVTANGTNCYLPSNGNTISGAITDGSSNIVGNTAGWDYDSGVITIDNSGSTYTDEYFTQTFTHNLGSVQLDGALLLANTGGFNDKVWLIPVGPSVVYNTNNHAHGALAFSLCYTSTNAAKLVLYAGESRTGGSITTSGDYLFNAVDPTAISAGVAEDDYNWADAGGVALKTIYVRLRLRRM